LDGGKASRLRDGEERAVLAALRARLLEPELQARRTLPPGGVALAGRAVALGAQVRVLREPRVEDRILRARRRAAVGGFHGAAARKGKRRCGGAVAA
jgi:hypothetical protein